MDKRAYTLGILIVAGLFVNALIGLLNLTQGTPAYAQNKAAQNKAAQNKAAQSSTAPKGPQPVYLVARDPDNPFGDSYIPVAVRKSGNSGALYVISLPAR